MSTKPKYRIVFRTYYSIKYTIFVNRYNKIIKMYSDANYNGGHYGTGSSGGFEKAQYEYHGDFNH